MTSDPDRRRAARLASLVAVPAALVAGLVSLWVFGGLGRATQPAVRAAGPAAEPVSMPAIRLGGQAAAVCRAVVGQLPDAIRDAQRRPVTAGAEQNAAYGDPPLSLTCGTPRPSVAPTATVYLLNGVCWLSRPASTGVSWTTVDRTIPVTVTVPGPADASAQWVIAFSGPVGAADPPLARPPTGCR